MNMRHWTIAAALLAVGIAVGHTTGSIAQDQAATDATTIPNPDKLAMQVAQAKLKMAEMNLERIKELNAKVPGTLITGMVQQFSDEVELARLELDVLRKTPGGDPYQAMVERMRLALTASKDRADRALKTFETAPAIMTRNDVERARLSAIIADLQLQRGLALEGADPHKQLQWQLELIGNELGRVRVYTYLLGQNRFGEFSPGL